jgi:hypothetical protein
MSTPTDQHTSPLTSDFKLTELTAVSRPTSVPVLTVVLAAFMTLAILLRP